MKKKKVTSHRDLEIYKIAFDAAMEIFELTKNFPREEQYSLLFSANFWKKIISGLFSIGVLKKRVSRSEDYNIYSPGIYPGVGEVSLNLWGF